MMAPDEPGNDQLDKKRRPREILHKDLPAGDDHGQEIPGASHINQNKAIGDQIEPPPVKILINERIKPGCGESSALQLKKGVDQENDRDRAQDQSVEHGIDRPAKDGHDRQRHIRLNNFIRPATETVEYINEAVQTESGNDKGRKRLVTRLAMKDGREKIETKDEDTNHDQKDAESVKPEAYAGRANDRQGPVISVKGAVVENKTA